MQIIHSYAGGTTAMEHIGSAHTDAELAALKAEAARRLQGDQLELGLDLDVTDIPTARGTGTEEQPWEVTAQRSGYLLDAIDTAYKAIGLDVAAGGDDVFAGLVTARILQPGSKYDSIRVLAEAGATSASYSTIKRRLPRYATDEFRDAITSVCADHAGIGPTSLVLYDVTTLYYEADEGDGFREPGFSKERRIDPQITVGMLTDVNGFPLRIQAFEGNKAETKTFLPSVEAFMDTYDLADVTVVADAGMISEANRRDLDAAGLSYVLGVKTRELPYPIFKWRNDNPGVEYTHFSDLGQPGSRRPRQGDPAVTDDLPLLGRPGPTNSQRDRRVSARGPQHRRRQDPGQAQPVREDGQGDQGSQSRTGIAAP